MKIKRKQLILILILGIIGISWVLLTVVAQMERKQLSWDYGNTDEHWKALIVFNPDLFYNLDEKICKSYAEGMAEEGWRAKVATIAAAKKLVNESFDLYIFCANTYNWAPDRPTSQFIRETVNLNERNAVAVILGSGSTARAKRLLEDLILSKNANLIASKTYWLMRPNSEAEKEKSNVETAVQMAYEDGRQLARTLK